MESEDFHRRSDKQHDNFRRSTHPPDNRYNDESTLRVNRNEYNLNWDSFPAEIRNSNKLKLFVIFTRLMVLIAVLIFSSVQILFLSELSESINMEGIQVILK